MRPASTATRSAPTGVTLCLTLALASCAGTSNEPPPPPDLPEEWVGAARVADFTQADCAGPPGSGTREAMTAEAEGRSIHVTFAPAVFRCSQEVQAFVARTARSIDLLVQPADMDPATVARCDCIYSIELDVSADPGEYTVALYRRGDHRSGRDEPVEVGAEFVTVR